MREPENRGTYVQGVVVARRPGLALAAAAVAAAAQAAAAVASRQDAADDEQRLEMQVSFNRRNNRHGRCTRVSAPIISE